MKFLYLLTLASALSFTSTSCKQVVNSKTTADVVEKTKQCSAYTKAGKRCTRKTNNASGKCWQHN